MPNNLIGNLTIEIVTNHGLLSFIINVYYIFKKQNHTFFLSLGVFYFQRREYPYISPSRSLSVFGNKKNKITRIPAAFPRECPLLFFFLKSSKQGQKSGIQPSRWVSLPWLSLAPEETLLKVSGDGLEEPHLTELVEPEH